MPRNRKFVPEPDGLEPRVVLTSGERPGLLLLRELMDRRVEAVASRRPPTVTDGVNRAFDSFAADYTATRETFLAAVGTPKEGATPANITGTPEYAAFYQYTINRVNLLSNELINGSFVAAGGRRQSSSKHGRGGVQAQFPLVVIRRISARDAPAATAMPQSSTIPFAEGTLGDSLVDGIPKSQPSEASASLLNQAQDEAIQAARVAILNTINVARTGLYSRTRG